MNIYQQFIHQKAEFQFSIISKMSRTFNLKLFILISLNNLKYEYKCFLYEI